MVVKGIDGRLFNVVIINRGDKYGRDDCHVPKFGQLVHDNDNPLVEFWDMSNVTLHGSKGQFVSRYLRSTLLEHGMRIEDYGLDLMGYEPSWKIGPQEMGRVIDWLRTL